MAMHVRAAAPLDADAVLPLDLVDQFLRVDDGAAEGLAIEAARLGALAWIEGYVGRSLQLREWTATFDGPLQSIRLPMGPVSEVTAFNYLDSADEQQLWPSSLYRLADDRIYPRVAMAWPSAWGAGRVSIQYQAGYEDVATEAPALISAALMLIGHLYRNREENTVTVMSKMPFGVTMLCDSLRTPVFC